MTHTYSRNFSEAVLDIYNSPNITLDSVSLYNNRGTGRLNEALRGNSGGMAIGFNMLPAEYAQSTLTISNCHFAENQANGYLSPEAAVGSQVYIGRGGGVAVYMNESRSSIYIEVTDSIFENNYAALYGGGLYFITTGYESVQHIIHVERCLFSENVADTGAAGISLNYVGRGVRERPNSMIVRDCSFRNNVGDAGGAFNGFIGEYV